MSRCRLACFPLLALLTVFASSCARRPAYVLDDDRMTRVLLDVHRAEGLLEVLGDQYRADSLKRDIMGSVLVKNGVSRAQYDSSLVWYGQHLKRLIRIYGRVTDSLAADADYWRQVVEQEQHYASDSGDSVSLWYGEPVCVFDVRRMTGFRDWYIPADTAFYAGDTVVWRMRVGGLQQGRLAVATLALCYPADSTTSVTAVVRRDTVFTLGLAADSASSFEAIQLSILVHGTPSGVSSDAPVVYADSISLLRLHRH